jgi:hypothetical protein
VSKRYGRVRVTWHDSAGPEEYWGQLDELLHDPSTIESVGWLIHENKKAITIASSISNSGCAGGVVTIPKCAIVERGKI